MKSASWASYQAAGAIPQEPDDDCPCEHADPVRCMADALERVPPEDREGAPERCPCLCHANCCPSCQGRGYLLPTAPTPDDESGECPECARCGGTGRVTN